MATTIVTKYGSDAPAASDIVRGELAVDTENGRLYTENSSGAVVEIGLNPEGNVDVTGSVTADDSSSADSTILTLANSYTTDAAGDATEIMFQHYRSYSPSVTDSAFIKATKTQAWDATGDRTSKLEFGTRNGATEPETRMTIMPDGNVGIGVAPLSYAKLHISSAGTTAFYADGTQTSDGDIFDFVVRNGTDSVTSIKSLRTGADDAAALAFGTQAAGGSLTERMRITSAGNVGIGTSNPTKPLHVESSVTNTNTVLVKNTAGTGVNYGLEIAAGTNATDHALHVTSSSGTSLLRVDGSGNVGIGTSSPNYPIHVEKSVDGDWMGKIKNTHATNGYGLLIHAGDDASVAALSVGNYAGAGDYLVVKGDGNVGIGTASPAIGGGRTYALALTIDGGVSGGLEDTGGLEIGGSTSVNDRLVGSISYFNRDNSGAGATTRQQVAIIEARSVTSDSNAGDDSGGNLTFGTKSEGGSIAEHMRLDSSGNVGIGTSSPNALLHVKSSGNGEIEVERASGALINIQAQSSVGVIGTDSNHDFRLKTNSSVRVTLDTSGNLLVGNTITPSSNNQGAGFINTGASGLVQWQAGTTTTSSVSVARFYNPNGNVGSIQLSGSATSYVTSSDQRLKDNIVDAPSASDDIDAIQVRSFDWKADGSHQKYGMVAQELQTVAPEAVSAPEDPEEMMGVDYSKLVPMMLKEIQSLRARVAQLES